MTRDTHQHVITPTKWLNSWPWSKLGAPNGNWGPRVVLDYARGSLPQYFWESPLEGKCLWEAPFAVSQKWIPFPTALIEERQLKCDNSHQMEKVTHGYLGAGIWINPQIKTMGTPYPLSKNHESHQFEFSGGAKRVWGVWSPCGLRTQLQGGLPKKIVFPSPPIVSFHDWREGTCA